ncbi:transposase [Streptomyces sp. NEAU-174]|uniref:transposase n=1 Tax=Streptomyces sp. NEAU-174 TaxID=3458254 RepID=UPI0040446D43
MGRAVRALEPGHASLGSRTELTLERLPAYAPELNPVELLWSAIKTRELANELGAAGHSKPESVFEPGSA